MLTTACAGQAPGSASQPEPSVSAEQPTLTQDREGNAITLPENIDRIISMGPSNTEVLVMLGCGDKIIAADEYSDNVPGIEPGISQFSMMTPDGEQIISLEPDVIFVTGMSKSDGVDPLKPVADAGVCIIYMPSSSSIEGIKEDVRYIAEVMDAAPKAEEVIAQMEQDIEEIAQISAGITDKKSVYFEIAAAPNAYSFGSGVFLHEMIELIGAENIFADQTDWMSVADEAVLSADPDVILTTVDYLDDPIAEIKGRPGWSELSAVKNDAVYSIDTDASNRPSPNIVKALKQMAAAVYPDEYAGIQ
jgi:iron complex transport system substrate-binding protein